MHKQPQSAVPRERGSGKSLPISITHGAFLTQINEPRDFWAVKRTKFRTGSVKWKLKR